MSVTNTRMSTEEYTKLTRNIKEERHKGRFLRVQEAGEGSVQRRGKVVAETSAKSDHEEYDAETEEQRTTTDPVQPAPIARHGCDSWAGTRRREGSLRHICLFQLGGRIRREAPGKD